MRLLTAVLVVAVFAGAASAQDPIVVPGAHTYLDSVKFVGSPPVKQLVFETVDVTTIQEGIDLAYMLTNEHPLADSVNQGHVDVVELEPGVYDSVYMFGTPLGVRSAIARLKDGVTVRGMNRDDVVIKYSEADYAVLAIDVGEDTVLENLTINGQVALRARTSPGTGGAEDDRVLNAGIGCFESASPVIRDVSIVGGGTGIATRNDCSPTIEGVLVARSGHHGVYIRFTGAVPVTIDRCTFVDNFDYGIYVSSGSATVTNTCVTHCGKVGVYGYLSDVDISYSNVYWNDRISMNPMDIDGDVTVGAGMVSDEPYYCDFTGSQGYDYHVCTASPNVGSGQGGVDIGAFGGACDDCISPVEPMSWTGIKALYR